jgi:hypothetical protein
VGLDSVWVDTFRAGFAVPPLNEYPLRNVLGLLRGFELAGEVIVLGAHYDCSASNEPGWATSWASLRAPGADDNASGVAVVLEAVRALREGGLRPRRTLLVAAFGAEETNPAIPTSVPDSLRHHLGSASLARRLQEEAWRVRGMVNVDMVAYNPIGCYVEFVADDRSQWLAHLGRSLIRELGLPLECNEPPFPYRTYSDHEAFARRGVPALLLIENDPPWQTKWPFYLRNPFYHTSEDAPSRLNGDQLEAVAKLTVALVARLLEGGEEPEARLLPSPTLLWASSLGDGLRLQFRGALAEEGTHYCVYEPGKPWRLPPQPVAVLSPHETQWDVPLRDHYSQFCLTAEDNASPPNISVRSDVYPTARGERGRILIVDGFDRWGGSGSWGRPYHWFATLYAEPLYELGFGFDTCANESIEEGVVPLEAYDAVFWLLGDESTEDETFSVREQSRVQAFLRAGGRLFVSGSELGWDLGAKGSSSDKAFLRDFLRCTYEADDAESYEVEGARGSPFEGLSFAYGEIPYFEDYPDVLVPTSGAQLALRYANGKGAGICFAGTVPGGSAECRVIVFGFPFETVSDASVRRELLSRCLAFFGLPETAVAERHESPLGTPFPLAVDVFPNPSNGATRLIIQARAGEPLKVLIWNVRGQLVETGYEGVVGASPVSVVWKGEGHPSGTYLVEAIQGHERAVRRVVLLR